MPEERPRLQGVFMDRDGTIGEIGKDAQPENFNSFSCFKVALSLLKDHGSPYG